jgi:predicted kinase
LHNLELIVFVGLQAAGKTTYYHEHFAATHVHVSKDLMADTRNRETKQMQQLDQALAAGRSVVVDNTNPTRDVRAPLIAAAKRHGARAIGIWFDPHIPTSLARNRQREGRARVPDVAIFVTKKKLVAPSTDEGFDEVRVVMAPDAANP